MKICEITDSNQVYLVLTNLPIDIQYQFELIVKIKNVLIPAKRKSNLAVVLNNIERLEIDIHNILVAPVPDPTDPDIIQLRTVGKKMRSELAKVKQEILDFLA